MRAAAFAILALLACAAVCKAEMSTSELDNLLLSSELEPVADPIPRILQQVLGDAPLPGSYAATTPTTVVTPEAPTVVRTDAPVTATQTEAAAPATPAVPETPMETPVTPTTAAPATQTEAAAPAAASTCPAGTKKVEYSRGTLSCVLAEEDAADGEVYMSVQGGVSVSSGNKCYVQECPAAGGRKMLAEQAQQTSPFFAWFFPLFRSEPQPAARELIKANCFYVCEADS